MKYDVAIIGAGISGLGVAYKLQDLNLKICLFDKSEIAQGTSNNSLRIIHGGLRYFQTLNIPRIIESIKAQSEIVNLFPDYVRKLDCYLPLNNFGLKSQVPMYMVGKLYQLTYKYLTGIDINTGIFNSSEVKEDFIRELNYNKYFLWNDYLLLSHNKLVNHIFEKLNIDFIKEEVTDYNQLNAKVIIDCTNQLNNIHFYQAINLITNKQLVSNSAISIPTKNRMLFLTPRENNTAIGTFYYHPNEKNYIELAINEFNSCSKIKISRDNIISIDYGLLPNRYNDRFSLYGNNKIFIDKNIIKVLNTKYTTFLTVGEKVKQLVLKNL